MDKTVDDRLFKIFEAPVVNTPVAGETARCDYGLMTLSEHSEDTEFLNASKAEIIENYEKMTPQD